MQYRSWDSETFLIRNGCQTPRLVCVTTFDGTQRVLVNAKDGVELARRLLADPGITLIGHHVFYDVAVLAAEDASLLPLIFQALQDGRIRCTKIRQMMIDNATGELKYIENEDGELKAQDYSLQRLVYRHTKRYAPKGKSCGACTGGHLPDCFAPLCLGCCAAGCEASFRLRYGLLVDIPVADWPEPARKYAQDDAEDTYEVFMAQERLVAPSDGEQLRAEPIPGEKRQTQAAWALYLTSTWGMRTDPAAVDALRVSLQAEKAELQQSLVAAGLVRSDEKASKDMKAIYARVTSAFTERGLQVPQTDGGRVATDRHTLKASGDEVLATVAEYTHVGKLLTTYVPVLEGGTLYPIQCKYNPILETFRTSCVAQGSLVETVRDVSKAPKGTPIEDVCAGDLVYAYDADKKLVIRRVTWAGQTGVRKVRRLHWRGGRGGGGTRGHVDLTADHWVRLTSGEYKAAGELQPGDRVMALQRGTSQGYARLWPTGASEITREHRFIYAQVTGKIAEHVHHDNENKLDNRVENLIGMTKSDHLSLHASNPSGETRAKRREEMRRRWRDDRDKLMAAQPRGDQKAGFRGFTGEQITTLLWKYEGRPTLVAKELGTDYETLMRYMQAHNINYLDIARQFTAHGERITPEMVARWRDAKCGTVKNKLKQIGLGYYRWREAQEQYGSVSNNHVITSVEDLLDEVPVYDLTVDDVENFIVNEICVHNCASPNMQNPPRKGGVRTCFTPRAGSVFITCDYSTLEMRTLAQVYYDFFGVSPLRDALNAGQDVHVALAAEILGATYEETAARIKAGEVEAADWRQGAKCFHPDTEILTRLSGWKKIGELSFDDEVAAAVPGESGVEIVWQNPTALQRLPSPGTLLHLKNEGMDLRVTDDHRMLVRRGTGKWAVVKPEAVGRSRGWANAGVCSAGSWVVDERLLRLAVATQADGSYNASRIRFGFIKQRKIDRLRSLLAPVEYTESVSKDVPKGSSGRVTAFSLSPELSVQIRSLLDDKKFHFGWLNLTPHLRSIVLEEARYWDSHTPPRGVAYQFCSTQEQNTDVLQAIAAITGKKTRKRLETREGENHKDSTKLTVRTKPDTRGESLNTSRIPYSGEVVCLSVPSSFVLVRDGGVPVVTGQCGNFGFPGGMGADAFQSFALQSYGTKITKKQSVDLLKAFKVRWGMDRYFDLCGSLAEHGNAEKIVFPRSGHVRGDVKYTAICNGFFQELAALGAKEALWEVVRECYLESPTGVGPTPLYGCRPVLFMHDEIMLEVRRDPRSLESRRAASAAGARLSGVMVAVMQRRCPDVTIAAQAVMMPIWHKGAEPQLDADGLLAPVRPVESVGADGKKKVTWAAMTAEELDSYGAANIAA